MKPINNYEEQIEALLSQMTLEEKIAMCHGNSKFTSTGVERLGIQELSMSDGPHGVRPEVNRHSWESLNRPEDACTYLPTGTALAATWNPELGRVFGEVLGSEARYRGKDIILGPGINIVRTPLCGRNFEYYSEDPCLISKISAEVVEGIQSQDVAACVKHFALNNQELDRRYVNVEVSDRALHEIYLRGFYSAIIEGGAYSVMGAYNRYKEQQCCHNEYLVNDILKKQWSYDGVYISDWSGCRDGNECIFNGLDIEMGEKAPNEGYYIADNFLKLAQESEEVRAILDDKVRRILRLMFRIHKFSPNRNKGAFNTKEHQQVTYEIASEAMILLKNDRRVLPMNKHNLKRILVVGPNADKVHAAGGNSSGVKAFYEITPLQGLQDRLGDTCIVEYERGDFKVSFKDIPVQTLDIIDLGAGCRAFKQTAYTTDEQGEGQATVTFCESGRIENGNADYYDIEVSVLIPETGDYSFRFATNGIADVWLDNKPCTSITHNKWKGAVNPEMTELIYTHQFEQDAKVHFKIRVSRKEEDIKFDMGWIMPKDTVGGSSEEEFMRKAAATDYVIYCGGLDHSYDSEGFDKKSMDLPIEQNIMIPKLLEVNPNTVVVLTVGSPVTMPWIDKADTVLWTWYAGMENGHVLSDILTGDICPSGKLPFTLPKEYADTPAARYGEYKAENCKYNDDIFVGYRGFDQDNIEPMFAFGYGLSYSKFAYSDLKTERKGNEIFVTFKVTNIGEVTAKETAQLYVGDPECSVIRVPKELRNFAKIELQAGETKEVTMSVTVQDLSFYDEKTSSYKLEEGEFNVYIGSSSRDIRLEDRFIYID